MTTPQGSNPTNHGDSELQQTKPKVMPNIEEYIIALKNAGRSPLVINPVLLNKMRQYGWSESEINQAAIDSGGFAGYIASERIVS